MFLYLCCNADITRFMSGNYHIRSSLHTVCTPPAFLTSDPDSLFGPCPGCIKVNPVTSSPKQASHTCLSLPPLKHQLTSLILRIAQLQMLSDASSPSENSPDPESPFPGVGWPTPHFNPQSPIQTLESISSDFKILFAYANSRPLEKNNKYGGLQHF